MVGHIVAHSRRVKKGIKAVRPMKAPTFENAYLDRARRTNKKKSCRHKKLLIIRLYDTDSNHKTFCVSTRGGSRESRREQEAKKYPQPQTKEESQQWLIHFLLREFNGDPIDPWNTSSVTNMYDWEAVVFNQPISQWQIKLATSCK